MLKLFNRKKKDNKGFTLVELVIVIAILAILVGLLAPQYTKYVEKSRKAADASNMDELVKVVKVYAADPANELKIGFYTIFIGSTGGTTIVYSATKPTTVTASETETTDTNLAGLKAEMENSIPSYDKTVTKSQKWNDGKPAAIVATVEVTKDGGTKVTYDSPNDFASYMANSGRIKTETTKTETKK